MEDITNIQGAKGLKFDTDHITAAWKWEQTEDDAGLFLFVD